MHICKFPQTTGNKIITKSPRRDDLSYLFCLEERVGLKGGGPVPLPHHLLRVDVAQQQLRPGRVEIP